jgi:argininosuccinate synthase
VERAVLLYYDEFHTPLDLLGGVLDGFADVTVLRVALDPASATDGFSLPTGWTTAAVDAVDRFCSAFLVPAIKANASYEGGYRLSTALAMPLLAEVTSELATGAGATTIVHGFAGNDQLRFEMGVMTLAPDVRVRSTASYIGSQNARNGSAYTVSGNLWGASLEGGPLTDPFRLPPDEVLPILGRAGAEGETHVVDFVEGEPTALDGGTMPLTELLSNLDRIGRAHDAGYVDTVEDGLVGLKTRALYRAPGAAALTIAHRDLELFASSRLQNLFKPIVDQAWAELVYAGYWFDPQRTSLDKYIDDANQWVTGQVRLAFRGGGIAAVGRRAERPLYTESEAVYRAGQDFGVASSSDLARALSSQMRAAARRGPRAAGTGVGREEHEWSG